MIFANDEVVLGLSFKLVAKSPGQLWRPQAVQTQSDEARNGGRGWH